MQDTKLEKEIKSYIGLDIGDKYTHFCVIDETGEITDDGKVRTNRRSITRALQGLEAPRVALEVGTHSRWICDLLADLNIEVLVANPRKIKLIHGDNKKDDRTDSEKLARLNRVDPSLLYPIEHRSDEHHKDLEFLKARDILVQARTAQINHVRGTLKGEGIKIGRVSAPAFASRVLATVDSEHLVALKPMLESIAMLTSKIKWYDNEIERLGSTKYAEEVKILRQVNGVGPITSLAFVLTLGDPFRFPKSRMVGSYLGLCPKRDNSGDSSPELRISKEGDGNLRRLLVQSAQYILGHFGKDSDLRRWGLKKAEGGKRAKNRAVTGVARKLAVLLHRLWVTGEVYEPLRNSHPPEQAAKAA